MKVTRGKEMFDFFLIFFNLPGSLLHSKTAVLLTPKTSKVR